MNGGRSGGVVFNNSCSAHYKEPLPSLVRLFFIGGSGLLACACISFLGVWDFGETRTQKKELRVFRQFTLHQRKVSHEADSHTYMLNSANLLG